jgi:uncharacterized cupin superfamily protein
MAQGWSTWDSTTHPCEPANSGKFDFDYNGDYDTERVLILTGRATVTPKDGSCGPITLSAGDSVFFHKGFSCSWDVLEPMTKLYNYFDASGTIAQPARISCDVCGVECFTQSWLTKEEEDVCPACYKKDSEKYVGAEYQEEGEACAEPDVFVPQVVSKKRKAEEDYVPEEDTRDNKRQKLTTED